MKVLYVSHAGELGGAERSLLDLMAAVKQAAPDAALRLIAGAEGPLSERARVLGIGVAMVPLPPQLGGLGDSTLRQQRSVRDALGLAARGAGGLTAGWRHVRALRRAIRQLAPDVLHTNDSKSHVLATLAAARSAPVVWHLRDFIGARPVMRHALRWLPRRPRACAAISEAVARDARLVLGHRADVRVLLNAVDLDHFSPAEEDGAWLDQRAGLPEARAGTVRVGLVATYGRWKGHGIFLESAAQLLKEYGATPIAFYIIGGPIYRTEGSQVSDDELRGRMAELGVGGRIGLAGFQADPARVYRSLDIVVHASTDPEPFGRTIAEAMACGRAVIASPVGGSAELFTDGHDAVAVMPGDARLLAGAVRALAADHALRRKLGESARRTAVERFSRDRLGRQALAIYRDLIAPA